MSHIKVDKKNDIAVLTLKGQFIGGEETEDLKLTLQKIADEKTNGLIIDLAKTTYLNSTALGVLIAFHTNFAKRNGKIVLCNISKSLENIFVITKLSLVFNISANFEEAMKFITISNNK